MKLSVLVKNSSLAQNLPQDPEITGLFANSQKVAPGGLFVSLAPQAQDRSAHIAQAIEKGAVAVVLPETDPQPQTDQVLFLPSGQGRQDYALLAANWFYNPGLDLCLIGVTGTNGKTTTTHIIKSMLEQVEDGQTRKVGLIGTNENKIGNISVPAERTTPDAMELQGLLRQMRDEDCTHVVMEVSSHALEQGRTFGLDFQVGIFTNLTQDHLDYHLTMENYRLAKGKLFPQCKIAVFNLDDPAGELYRQECKTPYLTYAEKDPQASLTAQNINLSPHHTTFDCLYQGESFPVSLPIPGGFTLYNALAALSCGLALDLTLAKTTETFLKVTGVKGRIEVVPTPGEYTVIIDYAHTPNALENILTTARIFTRNRLICLFGCGGNRDSSKRPIMGAIVQELSDVALVTSDNPRCEEPQAIIDDILVGMPQDGKDCQIVVEPLRKQGIFKALAMAEPGDVIVLAGKGHECYQEIQNKKHHMDEREIIAEYYETASH